VICVELTVLGVRVEPPKLTVAPVTKFVPVIVSWNGPPPATAKFGFRFVMAGSGLSGSLMVIDRACSSVLNRTSVTRTAKLKMPLADGVPEIVPESKPRLSPVGNGPDPGTNVHVSVTPPVAMRVWL
jgi:hypothetical protein